jgi:hypothetical protein
LFVLDDSTFGRLAVLICEDMKRVEPARLPVARLGAKLVLALVMDGDLAPASHPQRWEWTAAMQLADEPGSTVLVANSTVLTEKRKRAGRTPTDAEPVIGLAFGPESPVLRCRWRGGTFETLDIPTGWI